MPLPTSENVVISASGVGANKPFSAYIIVAFLADYELVSKGQCFPLYWYEKVDEEKQKQSGDMYAAEQTPKADSYIRHDAITDWSLAAFQKQYDPNITKEDIFYYVYGILHSPEYKSRFAADLKKMLPRIPLAGDFWAFSKAGRELAKWHLNYEEVEPFPVTEDAKGMDLDPESFYRVKKMTFGKKDGKPDKTVIAYNENLILRDIPLAAYDYVVNGKLALEWIMERYQVNNDKDSRIVNDPNEWSTDPRYIVDLIKRIIRVSIESMRIVEKLPPLNEATK
jgi:predicted helicase